MFILLMDLQFGPGLVERACLFSTRHHVGWLEGWSRGYLKAGSLTWLQVTLAARPLAVLLIGALHAASPCGLSTPPGLPHSMAAGSVRESQALTVLPWQPSPRNQAVACVLHSLHWR